MAVGLVIVADRAVLGPTGPWESLRDAVPLGASTSLERGLAMDQVELSRWSRDAEGEHRVVVMGSSRANAGFNEVWVPEELRDGISFAKLAHGGVGPFELRVMTEEVIPHRPAVAVFFLSEFDTHHPFSIAPFGLPFRGPAVADLARRIEARFFFQNRTRFFRMVAARWSRMYRFRELVRRGWLGDPTRFELDDPRLASGRPAGGEWIRRDWRDSAPPAQPPATDELFDAARAALPEIPERGLRAQVRQIVTTREGHDVAIQEGLVWATFDRLRSSGVEVILVEAPVHPLAEGFVEPAARRSFHELAETARRELGVHVLPLTESGPFRSEDFVDLTHLRGSAGSILTRRIAEILLQVLEDGR